MNEHMIVLKNFNTLFAEWLRDKINHESQLECKVWEELDNSEKENQKKNIFIQYIRSRREIESIFHAGTHAADFPVLCWWSGRNIPEEDIMQMINSGASGIINDSHDWSEIMKALHDVMDKGFHQNEIITEALYHYCRKSRILHRNTQFQVNSLGEREKKIIELRKMGKTSKEIGDLLYLSKKTIDKSFGDLYRRFDCNNFFELLSCCPPVLGSERV